MVKIKNRINDADTNKQEHTMRCNVALKITRHCYSLLLVVLGLLWTLLLLLSPIHDSLAFSMAKADASKPIEITADSLQVDRATNTALFEGKVEAVQGGINLRSDKMVVFYRDKAQNDSNGQQEENGVSKIQVDGNVFLSTPEETAQGKRGLYDVDKKLVTLSQSVIVTKGKSIIKGDNLLYNMTTGESKVWTGSGSSSSSSPSSGRVKGVFVPEKKKSE